MDVYTPTLVVLLIILAVVFLRQKKPSSPLLLIITQVEGEKSNTVGDELVTFRARFLQIYSLAIAADWLQGSFTYSLYKNTHQVTETTIASLFITGFLSAGIGAFFAGTFADRFGRKRACLSYCFLYAVSCLLIMSPNLKTLFIGRAFSGLATTILFTAFEAWMIAECNRLGFGDDDGILNSIFGTMSVLNGFIAIACGLVSQLIVKLTSSEKSPFIASIICLVPVSYLISTSWVENYGPRIFTVTYVTTSLEGSMYIMVFSWAGILISADKTSNNSVSLPFGIIFASLMSSMTLGSYIFKIATRHDNHSLQASSHAFQTTLSFAASGLLLAVMFERAIFRFWALCLFELSLGIYFPAVAYVKSILVPEEHRAKIYGAMRVPLNAFVMFVLSKVEDTDESREDRLVVCSGLLLIGIVLTARYMHALEVRGH
ncbi:unnamed protein product [Clonostachys chloroleuca]|uniref:Molybdate-anion transporter n=1 Tax=Clonostachys chloroleuca TaxID=1926264 RepID=A0AA35V9W2_9HYPO|nr:unnamed protein product [Clonostachys chloroleuca]